MVQKTKQNLPKIFGVIVFLLFTVNFFVFAWQEPTSNPPGGNVYAPVNIGSTSQTKTGDLTLKNLYLNATASEGNIYRINQLIGYNDIFIKGNSSETAPVYLAGNKIYAYTNSQTRLFIDTNGNVGIGTTSPGYKLTINGSIGTPNINHPYLVLDSSSSGNNNNEQSAQISLGESGRGSASLHLSYIGNGYGYIGMGSLGSDNIPDHWGLRFYYQNNDVYAHNNIDANDVYIRAAGKWASQLGGGGGISGSGSANYISKWKGSTSLGNSQIYDNGSRVGIGTTSPSYKLQVQGDVYANGGWLRVSGQRGLYFQSYGGGWYMTDSTYIRNYGSKQVYLNNYLYAPKMYDQNNTSYYVDPAGTSKLNCINLGGTTKCSWPSGGGGAPTNASYVVMSLTGDLSNERKLSAGNGIIISDGGANGNVTVKADTSYLQRRVTGSCSSGSAIRKIYSDGSVECEIDDSGGSMPGAGNGLYYSGSTLHIGAGTGISVGSNDVRIRYPSYSCPSGYSLRSINLSNGSKTCEKDDTGSGGSLVCTVKTITLNGIGTKYLYCDSGYQRMSCSIAIKNGYAVPYSSNGCKIHNDQLTFGVKGYAVCCKIQ